MNKEGPSIEESIAAIRGMADTLENGDISIEEAFSVYEKAMGLVKEVSGRLDEVAERIEVLSAAEAASPTAEDKNAFSPEDLPE